MMNMWGWVGGQMGGEWMSAIRFQVIRVCEEYRPFFSYLILYYSDFSRKLEEFLF